MNRPVNYPGVIGGMLVIGGAMSPMLHISIVGNWNYFKIEPTLATIACVAAVIGILAAVFGKRPLQRFTGWFIFAWLVFTFLATWFKVHDYFSIIPFKRLAAWLSHMITFRYAGWLAMLLGAVLLIFAKGKSVTPAGNK